MKIKSMRGKQVDFTRYMNEHGDQPALGNASMNARGDLLDAKGNIVRTRADITAEYHRTHAKSVRQIPIKNMETVFQTPDEAYRQSQAKIAQQAAQDDAPPADEKATGRTRKIVDSE